MTVFPKRAILINNALITNAANMKNTATMKNAITMKNATTMTDALLNASGGFLLLCAAMLFMAGVAFAGDNVADVIADARDSTSLEAALSTASHSDSVSEGSRLEVGMPIEQAIELLGGGPDSETEVGGACGMLDILTWDEDGTRIISVDGTVTSIVEGRTR